MVVEYHAGIGEDLVSGKIVPTNKSAYWNERMKICGFDASIFQDIELRSGFPQDIEWCVKNGKLYFLQTRPITTISHDKYQELLFVDQALKNLSYPDLEKTEVSEIAARPSPFTLSLLQRIYEKNGPVMNVYTKHRITYVPNDFLRIVGNELYIDRDSELKTLLSTLDFSGDSHSL